MNKKKSEILSILSKVSMHDIGAIKCVKTVKYLGAKVICHRKELLNISRDQFDKKVRVMRWKIG